VLEERLNDKKEQLLEKDLVLEGVTAIEFVLYMYICMCMYIYIYTSSSVA